MINPSKLKSLVDQQASPPSAPPMPDAEGGEDDDMGDDDMDDEDADAGDPVAKGNELLASWGEFGETLKDEADLLLDNALEVGGNLLLMKVPDDAIKAVEKSVDRMPDEISMGLAKYVGALEEGDCKALCAALARSLGDKADENLLYAYVHAAGQYAKDEIKVDDDFNVDEEAEKEAEEAAAEAEAAADAEPEADAAPAE